MDPKEIGEDMPFDVLNFNKVLAFVLGVGPPDFFSEDHKVK